MIPNLSEQHVRVAGRHFIVRSDSQGPRIVYERKSTKYGIFNMGYWHRVHGLGKSDRTLIRQILSLL